MSDVAPVAAPAVAPTNGAHPAAPQKPAAAIKTPVESKPTEVDDSEEYVIDGKPTRLTKAQRQLHFQKGLAADKRLKEAADARNKLADEEKLFEENPEEYYRKKGKDPDKVFADYLAKKAQAALLTPEQREAEKTKSDYEKTHKELAEYKTKEANAAKAKADQELSVHIEAGLIAAADKHGLDNTPETLDSLLDILEEFSFEYKVPITFDQAAEEHIRREREGIETKDRKVVSRLSGKKLLDYLGADTLARVKTAQAEADAASLKEIPKPQARPKIQVKAHEREVKGYLREADFDRKFLK